MSSVKKNMAGGLVALILVLCWPQNAAAVGVGDSPLDWQSLSLEELMDLTVTLASRKEQALAEAPAAIAAITAQDIRRFGAQSIAEALRLSPGMQVARIDASKWAVSARGFNSRFANKLLVQVDGRSVYTPLFSGVYWEAQDVVLHDVERIEVVRGPGATLWGANAVDGIINVVGKKAQDTQGNLLVVGGGVEERGFGALRHGGQLNKEVYYRLWAKYLDRDALADAADGWSQGRGGFRLDGLRGDHSEWTVLGEFYSGEIAQRQTLYVPDAPYARLLTDAIELSGGHLLGRWAYRASPTSDMELQVFVDQSRYREILSERRRTFDLDFQHRLMLAGEQDFVWGLAYRASSDQIGGHSFSLAIAPEQRRLDRFGAFFQDEVGLGRLRLAFGAKFEHNDFTGFEYQPSARLSFMPKPRHVLWAGLSRAVRTPSRVDDDLRFVPSFLPPNVEFPGFDGLSSELPLFLVVVGNRDFAAETVRALEAGYRFGAGQRLFADVSVFYNTYADLADAAVGLPVAVDGPAPYLEMPLRTINGIGGHTYGIEAAMDWRLRPWWRLYGNFSHLQMDLESASGGTFLSQLSLDATTPSYQGLLHSGWDLPRGWSVDCTLRYVDALPKLDIDGYADLDARLARRLGERMEVALVAKNLLGRRAEFAQRFVQAAPAEVERTLFFVMRYGF